MDFNTVIRRKHEELRQLCDVDGLDEVSVILKRRRSILGPPAQMATPSYSQMLSTDASEYSKES
jgi:hypothetical protein